MDIEATTRPAGSPLGIKVVVIATALRVVLIVVALLVEAGVIAKEGLSDLALIPLYPIDTGLGIITHGLMVAMLVVSLLCIWGLMRNYEWGWTLSIITAGVILALNLGWWVGGDPHYISMLVNAIAVFYLNQRDVRAAFRVGRE